MDSLAKEVSMELRRKVACKLDPESLECVGEGGPLSVPAQELDNLDVVQLYLISEEGCPGCDEAKNIYSDEIESGKIEVVDVYTELGGTILMELCVYDVPLLVAKLTSGRFVIVD